MNVIGYALLSFFLAAIVLGMLISIDLKINHRTAWDGRLYWTPSGLYWAGVTCAAVIFFSWCTILFNLIALVLA